VRFYLGTHMPHWLRDSNVPLFVSHRRLKRYRTLPVAATRWALDSGGFTELSMYGEWRTEEEEYAEAVARYRDEIGQLDWAAPMDWMCEPWIVAKSGKSVEHHMALTVANYVVLRDVWPDLPFVPVLQGWVMDDYLRCIEMYEQVGVDLRDEPTVGLGSVCRRQATDEIGRIVERLSRGGIRLHGFGVKGDGLARYGWMLNSADSMSWSARGRRIKPCPHSSAQSCANCRPHALEWRRRALRATSSPVQAELPLESNTCARDAGLVPRWGSPARPVDNSATQLPGGIEMNQDFARERNRGVRGTVPRSRAWGN
jgi:hypothetical protein